MYSQAIILELLDECKRAKVFIEYARYELEDGLASIGDQFPRKDDATNEIARLETVIKKANGRNMMRNQETINGLRALADFIEAHDNDLDTKKWPVNIDLWDHDKIAFARTIRILADGGKVTKKFLPSCVEVSRSFSDNVSLRTNVAREAVCNRVVVGQRIVDAQPAHTEDIIEWQCDEPLLKDA